MTEGVWIALVALVGTFSSLVGALVNKRLTRDRDRAEVDDIVTGRLQRELTRVYARLEEQELEIMELRKQSDQCLKRADRAEGDQPLHHEQFRHHAAFPKASTLPVLLTHSGRPPSNMDTSCGLVVST